MSEPLGGVRTLARAGLGASPLVLAHLAKRSRPSSTRIVTGETEACIEGFPRSANSLAVATFQLANPTVRLAHHLHLSGQISRAMHFGVPTALLLRPPADAVASFLVLTEGRLGPRAALLYYIQFHHAVSKFARSLALCRFMDVVTDPGHVTRRLNDRYGTAFSVPSVSHREIEAEIARRAVARGHRPHAVPNPRRVQSTESARTRVEAVGPLLTRARRIYSDTLRQAGLRPE